MYTKTVIAATFAGLAAAAPTTRQSSETISLITTHSGNSNVHLRSVVENGYKFWIGKETATYCPDEEVVTCPTGTNTQFSVSTSSTTVGMNVVVPGGQQLYVANDGSLSVTAPHSSSTGTDGEVATFTYTQPVITGGVGNLAFNGADFTACPNGEAGVYQIFALGYPGFVPAADCIGVNAASSDVTSDPVWEYV